MQLRSSLSTAQVPAPKPIVEGSNKEAPAPKPIVEGSNKEAPAPKPIVEGSIKEVPATRGRGRPPKRTASKDDVSVKPKDVPNDDVASRPQGAIDSKEAEAPSRRVTRSSTAQARKDAAPESPAAGSVQEMADKEEFEVEKIVAKYVDVDSKQLLYCVKWVGYSKRQNTWEPLKNLTKCLELVEEFEEMAKELEEKEVTQESRKRSISFEDDSDEEEENSAEAKKMKV